MRLIIIAVLFCFPVATVWADIYKYTDESGNDTFTEYPVKGGVLIMSAPHVSNQTKSEENISKWSDTPFDQIKMRSNAVVQRDLRGIKGVEVWMKYGKSQPKLQYFDCLRIGVGNSKKSIQLAVPDTDKYRIVEYVCNVF